jgi:hypothetical protein
MLVVRSESTRTSTEAGRLAEIWGSRACTRSATSITLAPGWRCTLMSTADSRSAQAASRMFSAASSIRGHIGQAHRRAVAPGDDQAAVFLSGAQLVVGVIRMEARWGPSKLPLAWVTLALAMAVRRSSRPSP